MKTCSSRSTSPAALVLAQGAGRLIRLARLFGGVVAVLDPWLGDEGLPAFAARWACCCSSCIELDEVTAASSNTRPHKVERVASPRSADVIDLVVMERGRVRCAEAGGALPRCNR